jgi:uncharacterized paraquat-inducible protein A
MKIKQFIVIGLLAFATLIMSCSNQSKDNTQTEQKNTKKQEYTCTMHPEVVAYEPGKCPKCGMELVLRDSIQKKDNTDQ